MNEMLPEDWTRVVSLVSRAYGAGSLLLHGSRAPGWPEGPVAESDYDVVGVGEVLTSQRARRPLWDGGPIVDLQLVSRGGLRAGQLLSPETHIMLRYGVRLGDWGWLDTSVKLSWAGADDAAGDAGALLEAAEINAPDNAAAVCRLAIDAVRKSLTLQATIGTIDRPPTWAVTVSRYAVPREVISAVRTRGLTDRDDAWATPWMGGCLQAARCAVDEAVAAVAGYPRNEADAELASLVR